MNEDNVPTPMWICGYSMVSEIPDALDRLYFRAYEAFNEHLSELSRFLDNVPREHRSPFLDLVRHSTASTWDGLKVEIHDLHLAVFGTEPVWPEPPTLPSEWLAMLEALDPE